MSTHTVNVIEISELRPHGNADKLEIVPIGGWQAVVRKGDFSVGDRAVYIQPDYTVPTDRDEFRFLAREGKERHRLKAVRLRGVLSYGLLIPLPGHLSEASVGDNVMDALNVQRYEPPISTFRGGGIDDSLPYDLHPAIIAPKFDIESLANYDSVIKEGEPVYITEKVHGANARYLFVDGVFYCGSRTRWLKPDVDNVWTRAAKSDPRIEAWCRRHEGMVLYGEVFGSVQSLRYGRAPGEVSFIAFAAMYRGEWIDFSLVRGDDVPTAPLLHAGPFSLDIVKSLAEEDSRLGPEGHMMEGVVVVPFHERRDDTIGRVALKHISARYWEHGD